MALRNKKTIIKQILLYALFILTLIYCIFVINLKLEMLCIQIQEIGTIVQEMNNKINNNISPRYFHPFDEDLYISIKLKITAYSSEISQTDSEPYIGAWNNPVRKGMIAVSRDLEAFGLTNGVPIIIEGYEHINTIILDRMGSYKTVKGHKIRIEKTLDIWMESRKEALEWGIKYLTVKIPTKCINIEALMTQ